MGLGFLFNIFFVLILLPYTVILLVLSIFRKGYLKILLYSWIILIGFVIVVSIVNSIFSQKKLDKEDYYGSYIIDRSYFPGKQADWQYNHYRFELKEDGRVYFYVTDGERIIKTYTGTFRTVKPYNSERLVIKMDEPTHHILSSNPTTYRDTWNFYLVFYSPKFYNVFFKKGKWEPI